MSASDMALAAAAQQPVQLSDDSSTGSNDADAINSSNVKAKISSKICSEQSQDEITSAMIEEIFGKEEEISRPTFKKRRYRLLDSIYKVTKPLKVRYGKNSLFCYKRT
ncbi:hypothetical protein V6N13_044531 [Hibiscus sabdariffa]|uniref:Uncharacterized protein n=1 Tax=Hibiscus sabdariffa TaxID=183260 RepID=A0ABR2RIM8_9ROSI